MNKLKEISGKIRAFANKVEAIAKIANWAVKCLKDFPEL